MNHNDARVLSTTSAAASLLLATAAIAQPSLTWVGTPLQVVDASADGTALVGTGGTQTLTDSDPAYHWSVSGGAVRLPIGGAGGLINRAGVGGVSADGQRIMGWLYNAPTASVNYPVTWDTAAPGVIGTYLTPAGATGRGFGSDISADGTRIAAVYELSSPATWTAFIRDRVGGTWTALDTPSTQRRFASVVLSRSAQHACGLFSPGNGANSHGYIWSAVNGFTDIGTPAGFGWFNARAISDDGRMIAGTGSVQSPQAQVLTTPFIWTQSQGFRALPLPSPAVTGQARSVAGDGVLVSGHVGDTSNYLNMRAVVWTPRGVITVAQLAAEAGVNVSNLSFQTADVIAADGSFIIGTGSRRVGASTLLDTYILRNVFIPRCDTLDFNRNGVFPEDQDVIDFFSVFSGGACSTGAACGDIDFNNNAMFPEDQDVVDFFDVLAGGRC